MLKSPKITFLAFFGLLFSVSHAQTDFYVGNGVVSSVAGTPIKVTGDVTVASTGTIRLNDALELNNNLNNTGKFHSAHLVNFVGAGALSYNANGRDTIGNLQVNATSLTINDTLEVTNTSTTTIGNTRVRTDVSASDLLLVASNVLTNSGSGYVQGPLGLRNGANLNFPIGTSTEAKAVFSDGIVLSNAMAYVVAEALSAPAPNNPGTGVASVDPDNSWHVRYLGGAPVMVNNISFSFNSGIPVSNIATTKVVQSPTSVSGPYDLAGNDAFNDATTAYYITVNGSNLVSLNMGHFAFGICGATAGNAALISANVICENDTVRVEATGYDNTATLQWISSTDGGVTWADIPGQTAPVLYSMGTIPGNTNPTNIALRTIPAGGCLADTSASVAVTINESIELNLKVFLQGAYKLASGGVMLDTLSKISTVSYTSLLDSVYSADSPVTLYNSRPIPKMYNNAAVPVGAVDVIKVEIWSSGVKSDSSYAWLMSDGSVKPFLSGAAGGNTLMFCGVGGGNYDVVVRHRNHIAVISASAHALNNSPVLVDLSTSGATLGNNTQLVDTGIRAMFAGNIYENVVFGDIEEVNSADFFRIRVANNLLSGDISYQQIDASFDGIVNASDVNILRPNANQLRISNAPQN
jgi:hypothetical protein